MKKTIEIHDALISLMPNVRFSVEDNDFDKIEIQDGGVTVPSRQDIQNEIERLQAIEDAVEYQHNRREQYPDIGDQLDMLWHAIDSESLDKTSEFYLCIKSVKDNNPKL
jgi:hypothetical protein